MKANKLTFDRIKKSPYGIICEVIDINSSNPVIKFNRLFHTIPNIGDFIYKWSGEIFPDGQKVTIMYRVDNVTHLNYKVEIEVIDAEYL